MEEDGVFLSADHELDVTAVLSPWPWSREHCTLYSTGGYMFTGAVVFYSMSGLFLL